MLINRYLIFNRSLKRNRHWFIRHGSKMAFGVSSTLPTSGFIVLISLCIQSNIQSRKKKLFYLSYRNYLIRVVKYQHETFYQRVLKVFFSLFFFRYHYNYLLCYKNIKSVPQISEAIIAILVKHNETKYILYTHFF